jgi:hypothetical protein
MPKIKTKKLKKQKIFSVCDKIVVCSQHQHQQHPTTMAFVSLALPYASRRTLQLLHIFQFAPSSPLTPHNFHRLHRLGYRIDWHACDTNGISSESALLTIPPRRSVYRDITEEDVGTRLNDQTIAWSHQWQLVGRKVLNPYIREPNAWSAAFLQFQTDFTDICLEFRNLNEIGKIKGPL